MLAMGFMYSWLRVWSGNLAVLANTACVTLKPVFEEFIDLPFLLGAVFFAPNSHPKVAELRDKGPFFVKAGLFGLQLLIVVWLFYTVMVTPVQATPFILLSGVSMAVSASRAQMRGNPHPFNDYLSWGMYLLASGFLLTILSSWTMPASLIIQFNVLHLLGVGTILAYPFLNKPAWVNLTAGLGVLGVAPLLAQLPALSNLGWLSSALIATVGLDAAPLFPFFGLVLLGIAAGQSLYPDGERSFKMPDFSQNSFLRGLSSMSKNSLAIYLTQASVYFAGAAALAAA